MHKEKKPEAESILRSLCQVHPCFQEHQSKKGQFNNCHSFPLMTVSQHLEFFCKHVLLLRNHKLNASHCQWKPNTHFVCSILYFSFSTCTFAPACLSHELAWRLPVSVFGLYTFNASTVSWLCVNHENNSKILSHLPTQQHLFMAQPRRNNFFEAFAHKLEQCRKVGRGCLQCSFSCSTLFVLSFVVEKLGIIPEPNKCLGSQTWFLQLNVT